MTYTKIVTGVHSLTAYLVDANDPEKGFRVNVGTVSVVLPVEEAAELAEYLWVHLPSTFQREVGNE